MDEKEFFSVLDLFPRVRSSSYCEDEDEQNDRKLITRQGATTTSSPSSSVASSSRPKDAQKLQHLDERHSATEEDIFWSRLQAVAEQKLSLEDSYRFCDAFKQAHKSIVDEIRSSDSLKDALLRRFKN